MFDSPMFDPHLLYHPDTLWLRLDGNYLLIGITDLLLSKLQLVTARALTKTKYYVIILYVCVFVSGRCNMFEYRTYDIVGNYFAMLYQSNN